MVLYITGASDLHGQLQKSSFCGTVRVSGRSDIENSFCVTWLRQRTCEAIVHRETLPKGRGAYARSSQGEPRA